MSGNQIVKKCLQDGYANCTPKCNSSEHTFTLITALTQDRPQEVNCILAVKECLIFFFKVVIGRTTKLVLEETCIFY